MARDLKQLRRAVQNRMRRFLRHEDDFVVCGAAARDHHLPANRPSLAFEPVLSDQFGELIEWSPHLTRRDVADLESRDAVAVRVLDGESVVGVNFFVRGPGSIFVEELGHEIPIGANEHFSCRTFVNPASRGQALLQHMIGGYARTLAPKDRVWGLVMTRNAASLRSLQHLGWTGTGYWRARTRFGIRRTHHEVLPEFDITALERHRSG